MRTFSGEVGKCQVLAVSSPLPHTQQECMPVGVTPVAKCLASAQHQRLGHQPMALGLHRALAKHQVPSVGWALARLRQVLAFRLPVPFDLQAQCRGKKRREA